MHKKLIIILFCMVGSAYGELEEVVTGPYSVSFDLGIDKELYEIEVSDPVYSETLGGENSARYNIFIKESQDLNSKARIEISKSDKQFNLSGRDFEKILYEGSKDDRSIIKFVTAQRIIDGKEGAIVESNVVFDGVSFTSYAAQYQVNNYSFVTILSVYGWSEGTLSLLKTIKIEDNSEIESTEKIGG